MEAGEPAEFVTAGDEGSRDGDEPDESDSSWHNDEEAEEVLSTDESIPEALFTYHRGDPVPQGCSVIVWNDP